MCLAVPMRVDSVKGQEAIVSAGTIKRPVNIQMLPGVKKGDYVLVHAGFAIQKVDPQLAKETLKLFDALH